MTDKKFTDEEIKKALECCKTKDALDCKNCPLYTEDGYCVNTLCENALNLINRYEAEIERLKGDLPMFVVSSSDVPLIDLLKNTKVINATSTDASIEIIPSKKTIRTEAIKEFAERLKSEEYETSVDAHSVGYILGADEIDNLVKEMTEGRKE